MDTIPSNKAVTNLSDLDPAGPYTYADYLLWHFKERIELIGGRIFKMSPSPGLAHQKASQGLNRQLLNFFWKQKCQVFAAPFDVRMPGSGKKGFEATVLQPDLCVVCDEEKLDEKGCTGAPDLIVEILSPGNSKREMREKFQIYESAGVREYWIVHPIDRTALVYILTEEGRFSGLAPLTEEDTLKSTIFPDLDVHLPEVFL